MNYLTLTTVALALAAIILLALWFVRKEHFITQYFNPGSMLERGIK